MSIKAFCQRGVTAHWWWWLSVLVLLSSSVCSINAFYLGNPLATTATTNQDTKERLKTTSSWILDLPQDSNTMPAPSLLDAPATFAASIVLDVVDTIQGRSLAENKVAAAVAANYYLSSDALVATLLQDIQERNSLVTADFTRTIYEENCLFNDGSDLDGAYPMKPWILGCKLLFCGDRSKGKILPESLFVSTDEISFCFESDLEFRGPFRPRVFLSGTITMTRSLETGRITSYQETWDKSCAELVRNAELQF